MNQKYQQLCYQLLYIDGFKKSPHLSLR